MSIWWGLFPANPHEEMIQTGSELLPRILETQVTFAETAGSDGARLSGAHRALQVDTTRGGSLIDINRIAAAFRRVP